MVTCRHTLGVNSKDEYLSMGCAVKISATRSHLEFPNRVTASINTIFSMADQASSFVMDELSWDGAL
jgi:hypothetical protein